ncbi:YkgJ family cysteine cluster protein [Fluviicola sp.]|uniref:YkgJ family cysteine cluster protein n=1 Tax=Fluviicola sp. TaxID=1917219 RepID=UPI003D27CB92
MRLAHAKGMSSKAFRDKYTRESGSVLHFNGLPNHTGKSSCGLYEDGLGCSVHPARPLACRLFPLGKFKTEQQSISMKVRNFPV